MDEDEISFGTAAFLEHFGVKGMKWGVRRKRVSTEPSSDDAVRAYTLKAKGKTEGVRTLSNKEIQDFLTRANLEQQFARLTPTRTQQATRFISSTLLGVGKQQVSTLANTAATKQVKKAIG